MFEPFAEVPLYPLVFPVFWGAAAFFTLAMARHLRVFAAARNASPVDHPARRLWGTVRYGLVQTRMFRDLSAGLLHFGIFWGFVLLTIGTAQWLVLRRHLRRSASWIAATALAWLGGLAAFAVIASPLWQPGQPVWLVAAIGALAGLAMAAVASAVTGFTLVRLLDRDGVDPVAEPTHKAGQST